MEQEVATMPDVHEHPHPTHIEVAVVTTSGAWPSNGFDSVPVHQKVRQKLEQAARALHITDITGWVALVDGRELNIEASYLDNGLMGRITVDYGPREGGGGCE